MFLLGALRYGIQTKQQVDLAIDLCSSLQDMRDMIGVYHLKVGRLYFPVVFSVLTFQQYERTRNSQESEAYLSQALVYLVSLVTCHKPLITSIAKFDAGSLCPAYMFQFLSQRDGFLYNSSEIQQVVGRLVSVCIVCLHL